MPRTSASGCQLRLGEEAQAVVPQRRQRLPAEEDADATGDDEDDAIRRRGSRTRRPCPRRSPCARSCAGRPRRRTRPGRGGSSPGSFWRGARSSARAKRQKCQESTETNGPPSGERRANSHRLLSPTSPARRFSPSPNGPCSAARQVPDGPRAASRRTPVVAQVNDWSEVPGGEDQRQDAEQPPQARLRDPRLERRPDPAAGQAADPGGEPEGPVRRDRALGVRREDGVRADAHDRGDPGARQCGRGRPGPRPSRSRPGSGPSTEPPPMP